MVQEGWLTGKRSMIVDQIRCKHEKHVLCCVRDEGFSLRLGPVGRLTSCSAQRLCTDSQLQLH